MTNSSKNLDVVTNVHPVEEKEGMAVTRIFINGLAADGTQSDSLIAEGKALGRTPAISLPTSIRSQLTSADETLLQQFGIAILTFEL